MIISMLITLIVFLLILSILVLIHEAGHYFVAKKFGIKVEEFGFGFPLTPPLWQKQIGETVYSFYPVIIGGFVKLYGEDEAGAGRIDIGKGKNKDEIQKDKDEDRAFYARPMRQQVAVIVAGVLMNVLLAVVVYYTYLGITNFKQSYPLIGNPPPAIGATEKVTSKITILEVSKNSPAEKAGIVASPYTYITAVNGIKSLQFDKFGQIIKQNAGNPISITWADAKNVSHTATVIPRVHPPKNQGALGITFAPSDTIIWSYDSPTQKLFSGIVHPFNLMIYNYTAIGYLIGVSVQEKSVAPVSQGVSGPIGIGVIVNQVLQTPNVQERLLRLLDLVGLLSMSLAVVNILPIPGLDGGRFFFIAVEAIMGKKMDPKVEGYIHAVGMVFLLALLFLVSIKDIFQYLPK